MLSEDKSEKKHTYTVSAGFSETLNKNGECTSYSKTKVQDILKFYFQSSCTLLFIDGMHRVNLEDLKLYGPWYNTLINNGLSGGRVDMQSTDTLDGQEVSNNQ